VLARASPMLSAFILSALLAQSPPSSLMPPLPPDWTPGAVQDKAEYARYIRKEPDGTLSSMTGTRRVCDCDPTAEAGTFASTFARTQGVTVAPAIVMACGQQAQRVILTGHTEIQVIRESSATHITASLCNAGFEAPPFQTSMAKWQDY